MERQHTQQPEKLTPEEVSQRNVRLYMHHFDAINAISAVSDDASPEGMFYVESEKRKVDYFADKFYKQHKDELHEEALAEDAERSS